ncbi:MAG: hypothetical protein V3U28_10475 [Candidatus Acidoferrales bacterium]
MGKERDCLAAAYQMNHFQFVACMDFHPRPLFALHDSPVVLDGHLLSVQLQVLERLLQREVIR